MKDCGDYFYIRDDIQVESLGGDKIATSFFYPIEKEVSLGVFERFELECVVNQLRKWHNIGGIGIWGRSMGAATAVLFTHRNSYQTNCLVLDSPFTSVKEMVQEVAYEHYKIPSFLVNMGLGIISGSIKKRIGIDIFKLAPIKQGMYCASPAIFISGKQDGLVTSEKVKGFCDSYNSKKDNKVQKFYLESGGSHNDQREKEIIDTSFSFIDRQFTKYKSFCVDATEDMKPVHGIKISIRNKKLDLRGNWLEYKKTKGSKAKAKKKKTSEKKNKIIEEEKFKSLKDKSKENLKEKNSTVSSEVSFPRIPLKKDPHGLSPYEMMPDVLKKKSKKGALNTQRLQLLSRSSRPKVKPKNGRFAYGFQGDSQDTRETNKRGSGGIFSGLTKTMRNALRTKTREENILSPEFLSEIRNAQYNQSDSNIDPAQQMRIMEEAKLDDTLILDDDEIINGDFETMNDGNDSVLVELDELDKYLKGVSKNLKQSQVHQRRASPPKKDLVPGTGLVDQHAYSSKKFDIFADFENKNISPFAHDSQPEQTHFQSKPKLGLLNIAQPVKKDLRGSQYNNYGAQISDRSHRNIGKGTLQGPPVSKLSSNSSNNLNKRRFGSRPPGPKVEYKMGMGYSQRGRGGYRGYANPQRPSRTNYGVGKPDGFTHINHPNLRQSYLKESGLKKNDLRTSNFRNDRGFI